MQSTDSTVVKDAGVLLEVPPVGVQPAMDASGAVSSALQRFGAFAPEVGVKETILASMRNVASPSTSTLVWVVSIDAPVPLQGPASDFVDNEAGFWLLFVDARTGKALGSLGAGRISDSALKDEAAGTLHAWENRNQLPQGVPLFQP